MIKRNTNSVCKYPDTDLYMHYRCEYMQTDDETSQSQVQGFLSLLPDSIGSPNSLLGGLLGVGNGQSGPAAPTRFRPQGPPPRFGARPQRPFGRPQQQPFGRPQQQPFRRPPFRPRPRPNCGIICRRRRKREVREKRQIQHNILKYE